MTRRSLSNLLSNLEQSLQSVWDWYEFQRALIGEEKSRVLDGFANKIALETSRYVGKTREELDDDFSYQTAELSEMAMLGMLVSTEAALRIDFIERVKNKKKDAISRRFRKSCKQRGIKKIRLEEDILEVWKIHGANLAIRSAVGEFKGALNFRNWLAHGRYWKPKLGRANGYDPVDVFDICKEMLQTVDLMPTDASSSI